MNSPLPLRLCPLEHRQPRLRPAPQYSKEGRLPLGLPARVPRLVRIPPLPYPTIFCFTQMPPFLINDTHRWHILTGLGVYTHSSIVECLCPLGRDKAVPLTLERR